MSKFEKSSKMCKNEFVIFFPEVFEILNISAKLKAKVKGSFFVQFYFLAERVSKSLAKNILSDWYSCNYKLIKLDIVVKMFNNHF